MPATRKSPTSPIPNLQLPSKKKSKASIPGGVTIDPANKTKSPFFSQREALPPVLCRVTNSRERERRNGKLTNPKLPKEKTQVFPQNPPQEVNRPKSQDRKNFSNGHADFVREEVGRGWAGGRETTGAQSLTSSIRLTIVGKERRNSCGQIDREREGEEWMRVGSN